MTEQEKKILIEKIKECSSLIKDKDAETKELRPIESLLENEFLFNKFFDTSTELGQYINSIKGEEKRNNKIWDILFRGAYERFGMKMSKSEIYLKLRSYAKILKSEDYKNNAYYQDIKIDHDVSIGKYRLTKNSCICGELMYYDLGTVQGSNTSIPKIGLWEDSLEYPVIGEDGNAWMTITPNETNTMKKPIEKAHGRVLTFGLGLGYFAYMASLKEEVESVTIVERSDEIIELFTKEILGQFKTKDKIKIVKGDMFEYIKEKDLENEFDYIFTDIWQDCTEVYLYLKTRKALEHIKNIEIDYWISDAIEQILGDEIIFDYAEMLMNKMSGMRTMGEYKMSIDAPEKVKELVEKTLDKLNLLKVSLKDVMDKNYMIEKILENM